MNLAESHKRIDFVDKDKYKDIDKDMSLTIKALQVRLQRAMLADVVHYQGKDRIWK